MADRLHPRVKPEDRLYFKIIGSGWMYLSTVLDDYSRYIIAWKLCSTMRAEDVTDTLDMALAASGYDQGHVHHKPRERIKSKTIQHRRLQHRKTAA